MIPGVSRAIRSAWWSRADLIIRTSAGVITGTCRPFRIPSLSSPHQASSVQTIAYVGNRPRDGAPGYDTRAAAREGWGYVVSSQGEQAVAEALTLLMDDQTLRERLGRKAQQVALLRHDAGRVRQAFWETLTAAARVS